MTLTAGVVAVQGDVSEHAAAIRRAADAHGQPADVREIRTAGVVPECDVLLLPGGESTAISRLLDREGIDAEIRSHVAAGKPLLATCAGLIVSSTDANDDRVETLDVLDVTVDRNAFGRQVDSFEAPWTSTGSPTPSPRCSSARRSSTRSARTRRCLRPGTGVRLRSGTAPWLRRRSTRS